MSQPKDPLAGKQQIVRDRMTQLEDRLFRLTERLAKAEPDQAKRVQAALKQARELLIRRNMEETMALLEQGRLTDAGDKQSEISRDLEAVLRVLLEDSAGGERQKELERLRGYRKQIQTMLQDQRRLKDQAEAVPRLQQMLADIERAIARLNALILRQQQEISKTDAATQAAAGAGELANSQKQVRLATGALADDLNTAAGEPPVQTQPASAPAERPDESAGSRPAGPPTDQPSEEGIRGGLQRAGTETGKAAQRMQSAEADLGRAAHATASPKQRIAAEHLQKALQELQKQQENARQLLDQAKAAQRQRELQQRAETLARQMQGPAQDAGTQPAGGDSPGGQQEDAESPEGQPGSQDQQPAPGAQNVQQAGQHMQKAAEGLDQSKPQEAAPQQAKAVEELEEAERQLQEILEQLRKEQQEELLRGLESRFRAMLAQQQTINGGTDALAAKPLTAWAHPDELAAAGLSQDEKKLADDAGQALKILQEDGTTVVFPKIVAQLQQDMLAVAGRLGQRKLDDMTRLMQADLVTALKELIESVKQMQEDLAGGKMAGGGRGGNDPLLPGSAELKLLRSCQERINRQTTAADQVRSQSPGRQELQEELRRIAERQKEVAEMARKMNEVLTGE